MTAQAAPPPGQTAPPAPQATRRPPRRPPPRRSRLLAALAYAGIAILFLVVAAATFLLVAPPVEIARDRLVTEFQARTGYLLEINGTTSLRFQPAPSIEFRDVVVATPGEHGSPVLRAESIEVEPRLSSLWRGRPQAERITLRRPQVDLVIDKEGRRKWQRAESTGDAPGSFRVAQLSAGDRPGRFAMPVAREEGPPAESTRDDAAPAAARERGGIALPDIRIADGIIRYRDLRNGTLLQSDQIQIRVSQRAGKQVPVQARGSFAFGGEIVKFEGGVELPEGRRVRAIDRLVLRLEGRHGHARYDGTVSLGDQPAFAGNLDVATPSARDAVRWLGKNLLRDGGPAGPLALKGRIDSQPGRTEIEQLDLSLEGIRVGGRFTLDHAGQRPRFGGDLDFAELDFDRMREKLEQRQAARGSGKRAAGKDGAVKDGGTRNGGAAASRQPAPPPLPLAPDPNDPAEDGAEPADPARGPRAWRTDPVPFAALAGMDGEARLKVARLVWRGATLTDAAGALALADGTMKIDIRQGALHGGQAKGVITASAAGHVGIDLMLDDVSALETLSNSGRFEMLDGRARIRLAVAGHGATEKDIIDTLAGTAALDIQKGAIVGWSIDNILASARRLELPNLDRNSAARTPFERMTATLVIKDGVATGNDMRIASSPISLDAAGTVDLRARTLDLTLNPRIADNPGAGASSRFAGLSVPLQLSGPWHRPRLRADYQKILKSPAKALDAARDAARGIKDDDIDKAAKRLLGDSPEAEKGAKRAKELLKRFLDR